MIVPGKKKNNRGIALLIVLWVLVLLSVIVGEFCHAMRTEINIIRNFKEEMQAYYIARAGFNVVLREMIRSRTRPGASGPNPPADNGADKDSGETHWRVNAKNPAVSFANGAFTVSIDNESGKININQAGERLLGMLFSSLDIDEKTKEIIVDSILDWRDADDLHRINGAEDNYYERQEPPYTAKNGDFDSIEELLLVRGISAEIFYRDLKDMFTVYTAEERSSGGSININAASGKMLRALPGMKEESAIALENYRKEKDIISLSQIPAIVGDDVYAMIAPYVSLTSSPVFTIRAVGNISGSPVKESVAAVVKTDVRMKNGYILMQWLDHPENPLYFRKEKQG